MRRPAMCPHVEKRFEEDDEGKSAGPGDIPVEVWKEREGRGVFHETVQNNLGHHVCFEKAVGEVIEKA